MTRTDRLRKSGVIPERQHDAFLFALLAAVCLNGAFFAIQSIIPFLLSLVALAYPELDPKEENAATYAFEYVAPSLLDEPLDPNQAIEAESSINRRARQLEAEPDLPEGFATVREGLEEYLTAPDGNPGENLAYVTSPGQSIAEFATDGEDALSEPSEGRSDATMETADQEAVSESASRAVPLQPTPDFSQLPPLSQMFEMDRLVEEQSPFEPEQTPIPPEMAKIFEEIPPPPTEFMEEPPPNEDIEQVEPDTPEQLEIEETEPAEPPNEDADPDAQSPGDIVDLASLPIARDGFLDSESRRLETSARRSEPQPIPQLRAEEIPEVMPTPLSQPPASAAPLPQPEKGRSGRQPSFKNIGGASEAGGAPPRRNTGTSTKLLAADTSMALLESRYAPYMRQVWEKLQNSLTREMILSPLGYSRGQVKIRFGISADGSLTYQETVFPDDGSMPSERAMSERMLREAGPFDPLTPEMQRDELFQKMSVIVTLF